MSVSSAGKETRLLCWRCFNTEIAEADGLDDFQHYDLDPMRLADSDGRQHDFHFRVRLLGDRVALDAFELRNGSPNGYQFRIIGDAKCDLLVLMSRLLEKMRRGLAIRHLEQGEYGLHVAGDVVRGRIEWDSEEEGRVPLVVIDGREISWEHFGRMMMSFEGWHFKLKILDPSEEE